MGCCGLRGQLVFAPRLDGIVRNGITERAEEPR